MAGRTHGQRAVPITSGLKVAIWAGGLMRHLVRFDQLQPRLLTPMTLPARNPVDHFAELVCLLGMVPPQRR